MKKIIVLVLASLIIAGSLCSCGAFGSSAEVEDLIKKFESSCNELDIDGILDCIDPKISNGVETVFGFLGAFSDMENDEIFNYISEALISEEGLDGAAFFESIGIKIETITVIGEEADVECIVTYKVNKEEMKREAVFTCIYYAEEWYISSFVFE